MKPGSKERFLVDDKGHKQDVVIDVESYREMMEDIADLRGIAERKNNPKVSVAQCVLRLKKHGLF